MIEYTKTTNECVNKLSLGEWGQNMISSGLYTNLRPISDVFSYQFFEGKNFTHFVPQADTKAFFSAIIPREGAIATYIPEYATALIQRIKHDPMRIIQMNSLKTVRRSLLKAPNQRFGASSSNDLQQA